MGIEYQFTRNIPSNLLEESEIAGNLAGITSEETQLKVLSIVDNVKEELARKKEDQDELAYQTDYPTNRTGGELDTVVPKIEEAAEVQGKQLNGAQTQSLIAIMAQFTAGGLTEGQAINLSLIHISLMNDGHCLEETIIKVCSGIGRPYRREEWEEHILKNKTPNRPRKRKIKLEYDQVRNYRDRRSMKAVSYTHLDVYKRQVGECADLFMEYYQRRQY